MRSPRSRANPILSARSNRSDCQRRPQDPGCPAPAATRRAKPTRAAPRWHECGSRVQQRGAPAHRHLQGQRDVRSPVRRRTIGGKYRVSSKAGRSWPGPANFESGSLPCFRLRPEMRGQRGSGPPRVTAPRSGAAASPAGRANEGRGQCALVSRHSRFAMRSRPALKAGVAPDLHDRGRLPLTQGDAGAARADDGATTAAPSRPNEQR